MPRGLRGLTVQVYSIVISQFRDDAWRPVNLPDLQLEVTMLDPHLRVPLLPTSAVPAGLEGKVRMGRSAADGGTATTYSATFKLPDRHGVFALIVDHRRADSAQTHLRVRDQISITPLRNDEYPRFIVGAWPFYAGAISSAVAWLVFCAAWLALDPVDRIKPREKAL